MYFDVEDMGKNLYLFNNPMKSYVESHFFKRGGRKNGQTIGIQ